MGKLPVGDPTDQAVLVCAFFLIIILSVALIAACNRTLVRMPNLAAFGI
jgi:hypothetical protein